jgi:bacterioferritin-associated ferredoxin
MKRKTVPLVCCCGKVSRTRIVKAIRAGATTLKQIQKATGAGVGKRCKELNPKGVCCIPDILAMLKEETGKRQRDHCSCPHCRPR